jgi:hypothetical protein
VGCRHFSDTSMAWTGETTSWPAGSAFPPEKGSCLRRYGTRQSHGD